MAQKVNPIALRLQYTNRYFDNSWYSKNYYDKLVSRDLLIQKYINTFLKLLKLPLGRFSIQYLPKKTRLFSFFCYPKKSREIRSRIFGVSAPYIFRKKKFFRQNKSNKKFHNLSIFGQNFFNKNPKSKKRDKIISLYNKNLWFSENYSSTNSFILSKHKNLFFINNLSYSGINKQKRQNLYGSQSIQNYLYIVYSPIPNYSVNKNAVLLFSEKKDQIKKSFNNFFFKFFINLVIQNQLILEKKIISRSRNRVFSKKNKSIDSVKHLQFKKPSSDRKNLPIIKSGVLNRKHLEQKASNNSVQKVNIFKNIGYSKNLLKYFLIFNNSGKNLYPSLDSAKRIQQHLQHLIWFDSRIQDYLIQKDFSKSVIQINKNVKNFNPLNKFLDNPLFFSGKKNQIRFFSRPTFSQTKKLPFQAVPFGEASALSVSSSNMYNPTLIQNNQISNISSYWKLNNIENKYKYKNYIQRSLTNIYNLNFEFIPFKVKHDWQSAGFLADEIVYFLERRVPFRRLKNKLLKQLSQNSNIRGIRITCSGRGGGKSKKAQRAKTECVKFGQTSLHVFSSQIDFAVRTAQTSFGSVGIKVWICYN